MTDPVAKPSWLKNTLLRVGTALVLAPLVVLLALWSNPLGLWALVLVATGLAINEFLGMAPGGTDLVDRIVVIALGLGLSAGLYFRPEQAVALSAGTVVLVLGYGVARYRVMETIGGRLSTWLAGIFYCGVLFTTLSLLKKHDESGAWVLLAMAISWFGDTGAYFTGKGLGGPKIYPAISPNKTWSGSLGGLAAGVLAGVLAKLTFMTQLSWGDVVLVCLPAGVLGQVGDFAESLFKRSFGVKDSGNLLPGHGGMLDRVDALMFVSAYLLVYVTFVLGG
jgi:phosphatidate cytidylyltransferase